MLQFNCGLRSEADLLNTELTRPQPRWASVSIYYACVLLITLEVSTQLDMSHFLLVMRDLQIDW